MKTHIVALGMASTLALASTAASAALDDAKAQELMKNAGCTACHTVDKKLVGPSYHDMAQKRKGDPSAIATLEKKVRDGSKGEYGQIPMPPNPAAKISDADLHEVVQWVLTK